MKRTLITTAMLLGAACSPSEDTGGYLNNPATATAGVGAAGQGVAGMPAVAGTAGQGAAGMAAPGVAGTGAAGMMPPTAGTGAAGMMAVAGAGAAGAAGMMGTAGMAGMGAAGMGAAGMGAAGMGGGNTPGTVTVSFTTVSYGGEYAPGNYGAVWFETPSGEFIKTAKRWAGTVHASDLATWTEASGGWGSIFGGGNGADMMDAMSSATLRNHQMHTVTWNMMDAERQLVPDGEYVAVLEVTESRARDRNGPVVRIPFTKGPSPMMATAPDQEGFSGVTLMYEP